MIRPAAEKFTQQNIEYCQAFLDYISTIDPRKLKFFDESGLKLPDVANPNYGHSRIGTPCAEIFRNMQTPIANITLNLLCEADGIMYTNTVFLSNSKSKTSKEEQQDGYYSNARDSKSTRID